MAQKGRATHHQAYEVCRLRDTPIITFINKLDREIRDPIEVLDEIEDILQIQCAPMNWPIDREQNFKGIYDLRLIKLSAMNKVTATMCTTSTS